MNDPAILSALLRREFALFLGFAYREIGGEGPYQHNWHIDAMVHQLELVRLGENRRLMITLPPRHLKSIVASIAWVAWMLGLNPALRFICASYGNDLAEKHAGQCLRIMQAPWYREAFPGLHLTRRSVGDIETSRGGGRFSTSLGGALTGFGADIIVIDDPMKACDVGLLSARTAAKEWLLHSLMSRLNDQERGAIILVMQRLHEDDLVGELQQTALWQELKLPALATEDDRIPLGQGRCYQRRAGYPLHSSRLSIDRLAAIKVEVGSLVFSAQYQQDPIPALGNLVKAEWLRTIEAGFAPGPPGQIVQSWDTATKDGLHNDWSVCVTAHVTKRETRIIDIFRRRLTFPDLKRHAVRLAREHTADVLLVEDQASGSQLVQMLRSEAPVGVPAPLARKPEGDKQTRLAGVSSMIEAGGLYLPPEAFWLADFKHELLAFPRGRHDDQVDALSQLLAWVAQHAAIRPPTIAGPIIFYADEYGYVHSSEDEFNGPWMNEEY